MRRSNEPIQYHDNNELKTVKISALYTAKVQLLFVVMVIATTVAAFLLTFLYHAIWTTPVIDPSVLLPQHRIGLSPKPVERFVFISLAFTVAIVAYLASTFYITRRQKAETRFNKAVINLLPMILAAMFFLPFVGFDFSQALVSGKSMPPEHPLRYLGLCLVSASAWFGLLKIRGWKPRRYERQVRIAAWIVFVAAMLLQMFGWRILGNGSINAGGSWWNSVDAVVFSIGQVTGGKTVLADFPAQYGLYAEFIGPVFKAIPFSVLGLTGFFALLQVISLSAVFHVVQRYVHEPVLKVTAAIALVMITFETSLWLINIQQPYFQYWPIRFFWPASSVLAFDFYTRRRSMLSASIFSVLGAAGSLWNADSGLMIELAFGAFLLGKWGSLWFRHREVSAAARSKLLITVLLHALIFVVVVGAMFAYIDAKADRAVHWSWLFEYQRLFYGLGFMMLPLPMQPHPWMPILALYLIGMVSAVAAWDRSPAARGPDLIFYISFLGLGLFLYYEGRSHVLNLISVSWPAFLLAVILGDRVLRLVRANQLAAANIVLPTVSLALVLFCCIPYVRSVPLLWRDAIEKYESRGSAVDPKVVDELAFIRERSFPGHECMILSKRQGLYYALSRTASPVVGPGYAELLTMRDRANLLEQLQSLPFKCIFVGVGPDSEFELGVDPLSVLKNYSVVATSIKGTMLYLLPKSNAGATHVESPH